MNLKAYRLALIKDSGSDGYRSRISFSLGPLPLMMSNVSVTALATTLSINSQTTKSFTNYTKTLVQVHRWNSTPPQFIYLDLHGNVPDGVRVLAHIIVLKDTFQMLMQVLLILPL